MFPYQDPAGSKGLERQGALAGYRSKLQFRYEKAAAVQNTRFVPIERLSDSNGSLKSGVKTSRLTWSAFPERRQGEVNQRVDRDRQSLQEEYVEWNVQSRSERIETITFCTEFPEYFEALADVNLEALVAEIRAVIPDANPTVQELLGQSAAPPALFVDGIVGPKTWSVLHRVSGFGPLENRSSPDPTLRIGARGADVRELQQRLLALGLVRSVDGDFGPRTDQGVKQAQQKYTGAGELFRQARASNPWNNGSNGIYCLLQPDNTLPLLFQLVAHCSVPRPQLRANDICRIIGTSKCVPGRSSDPNVCATAQQQVLQGRLISLRDPAGIRIDQLLGSWSLNGSPLGEMNGSSRNTHIWQVSRNGRRGVLNVLPGLELNGSPIRSGAQVARQLVVGVDVVTASASSLT